MFYTMAEVEKTNWVRDYFLHIKIQLFSNIRGTTTLHITSVIYSSILAIKRFIITVKITFMVTRNLLYRVTEIMLYMGND